jgi:VanZ family protein
VPRRLQKISRWLPVVVWMTIIFSASSDRASFQHSSRLVGPLVRWLFPHVSEHTLDLIILGVRKCAHITEYAILALLCWIALPSRAAPGKWEWSRARNVLLLVAIYAATDECHQLFVPSRQASIIDVLIDTLGGALGLLFVWIVGRWRKLW